VDSTLAAMPPPATQVPPATPTPIQVVVTATPVAPTATLTPVPVTPPPGDPATLYGKPDGLDTFDNDNNWTTFPPGDNSCFSSEISDGLFWMTALGQQGSSCWEVSWPKLGNFYIDLTIKMPETCDANDRFGLLFRAPENTPVTPRHHCGGVQSFSAWTGRECCEICRRHLNRYHHNPGALQPVGVAGTLPAFYINGVWSPGQTDFPDEGKTASSSICHHDASPSFPGTLCRLDSLFVAIQRRSQAKIRTRAKRVRGTLTDLPQILAEHPEGDRIWGRAGWGLIFPASVSSPHFSAQTPLPPDIPRPHAARRPCLGRSSAPSRAAQPPRACHLQR
jgi:hypothetical protein